MIVARTAHLARYDEPTPRRGVIGHLLLGGIEYTNARPWIGFAGLALTIVAGGVLERLL
jgi:hypothetical protein